MPGPSHSTRPDAGDPVTDPRFIYQDDANVIAYRLGLVESGLSGMDQKLDIIIKEYPTVTTLSLILDPLKEKVKELEEESKEEAKNKIKNAQQIKYLTYAAIAGPLGTFIITIIMSAIIKGKL